MTPLRIVFIDIILDPSKPGRNGLSDLVWDMASNLRILGNDVHVIGPYTSDDYPDRNVTVHQFNVPSPGYRNIIGHFRMVFRALNIANKIEDIDIIHTPEYFSGAIISTLNKNTPLVFTEPGNIFERLSRPHGNPYDWLTTQIYKICARIISKRCAQLFATSETMVKWWNWTGIPLEKITLVPLGIQTSLFKKIPNARQDLGYYHNDPIIVYSSRFSPENGPNIMLQAFKVVSDNIPDAKLWMIGDGNLTKSLKAQAEQLLISEKITWFGWVEFDTLPLYYSAADIFVFSGFTGGTPRVLLQAMACGLPVIGSEIGGIVDHIDHGKNGYLIPAGDFDSIAKHIVNMLSDDQLRNNLGDNGQEYIKQNLS